MHRYSRLTLLREILTIIAVILLLLPFYVLVTTSLKSSAAVIDTPALSLNHPSFSSFVTIFQANAQSSSTLLQGLINSIIITVGTVLVLVLLGSMTGYVISRRASRWSSFWYYLFVVGVTVPTQLGVIPLYAGARTLGLTGSIFGMIVVYSGLLLPLSIFFYAGFFRALPHDYEEAATIDGASRLQTFFRVVFPLMRPVTGSVAIVAGLFVWNDFFTALIFLNGSSVQTLPLVVYNFVGAVSTQWNLVFATVIVSMIPILIFYLFAQRQFIQGFSGGIKS